jgi:PleD family two-component response regulator
MSKPKKNSVLIIDDDNANIMALTNILHPEYTVYGAKNGEDGIKASEKYLPDVILLDIMMPEMDGYTVLKSLKSSEATRDIPIIFITALSYDVNEEKGLALGAADYIAKPFTAGIVKLRVQNQIKIINQMRLIIEKEIAEKSSRAKLEFLSKMSHDMLTPMNAIMGFTEIAKTEGISEETEECLKEIEKASNELLELLKNLLGIPN